MVLGGETNSRWAGVLVACARWRSCCIARRPVFAQEQPAAAPQPAPAVPQDAPAVAEPGGQPAAGANGGERRGSGCRAGRPGRGQAADQVAVLVVHRIVGGHRRRHPPAFDLFRGLDRTPLYRDAPAGRRAPALLESWHERSSNASSRRFTRAGENRHDVLKPGLGDRDRRTAQRPGRGSRRDGAHGEP